MSLKSLQLEELGCREELQEEKRSAEAEGKRTREASKGAFAPG